MSIETSVKSPRTLAPPEASAQVKPPVLPDSANRKYPLVGL